MPIYHSTDENLDYMRARLIVEENLPHVLRAGGSMSAPNAPVETPAIIVLELPEGVTPLNIVPDLEFKLVEGVVEQ